MFLGTFIYIFLLIFPFFVSRFLYTVFSIKMPLKLKYNKTSGGAFDQRPAWQPPAILISDLWQAS